MNPKLEMWTASLRSGIYAQGSTYLCAPNLLKPGIVSYDPDGVACDIALCNGVYMVRKYEQAYGCYSYHNRLFDMPFCVAAWLGISEDNYTVSVTKEDGEIVGVYPGYWKEGVFVTLAAENDRGITFSAIADIIESKIK